jgi:hypothetical protein
MNNICAHSAIIILDDALCHSCPPWNFFQEHNPHSITKAEGLAMKHNIAAQQNTVGHKQKVSNETTYNISPHGVKRARQSAKKTEVDSHRRSLSLR